jgi:hypothetical protein
MYWTWSGIDDGVLSRGQHGAVRKPTQRPKIANLVRIRAYVHFKLFKLLFKEQGVVVPPRPLCVNRGAWLGNHRQKRITLKG